MRKAAVVAAGVLALAGTTILMAQDRGPEGHRGMGPGMMQGDRDHRFGGALVMGREHRQLSADDMRAFAEARIAALHAGLALRPDQEKNWPPFEQALRTAAKDRIDRIQARQAAGDGQRTQARDPVERLKRVADAMSKRGTALRQIADTAAPLYGSLDDAQKDRFRILARFGRHHHMGWRHRFERRGEEGNNR
jgi:LTXXQ motif family protein